VKIGIIGPCEEEIQPFIESINCVAIEKYAKLCFHIGKYSGISIVALFCGVCKVNAAIAAQILIDKFDITHMIVTGVAGAIDERLKIYDTVISSEVAYHDVAEAILTQYHPWMESVYFKADGELVDGIIRANAGDPSVLTGKMVTGEAFIAQDGRDQIIKNYSPQCVDMETASVAHVCYANAIPFVAVRSMSDTPDESGNEAFEKYFKTAAEKSINVLKKYLDSIHRAP
jgi:adenosylhomocysteine nucleosidase